MTKIKPPYPELFLRCVAEIGQRLKQENQYSYAVADFHRVMALLTKCGLDYKEYAYSFGTQPLTVQSWCEGKRKPPDLRMLPIAKDAHHFICQKIEQGSTLKIGDIIETDILLGRPRLSLVPNPNSPGF